MRFKFGKCLNSLSQFKIINFFSVICKCFFNKNNNNNSIITNEPTGGNNSRSGKKYSIRRELKLIYYTLCYNESNDALAMIETCFSPIAEYFSQIIRWFGRVNKIFLLTLYISVCGMSSVR